MEKKRRRKRSLCHRHWMRRYIKRSGGTFTIGEVKQQAEMDREDILGAAELAIDASGIRWHGRKRQDRQYCLAA